MIDFIVGNNVIKFKRWNEKKYKIGNALLMLFNNIL